MTGSEEFGFGPDVARTVGMADPAHGTTGATSRLAAPAPAPARSAGWAGRAGPV
ncbi:hypothetical protein [Streptomyces sp. NPDC048489]|uniref:hypothetical protein n=1 Tax=Streptomyces sp. NPDC048489 TaxID=3154504 RepID=UPI0034335A96